MNTHNKIMRFFAHVILVGILFQTVPSLVLADSTAILGTVSITHIEQQGNNVAVAFQPLPEGLTVTARVDSEGRGDYLTLQSALADIKTGLIAVSKGRYNEHDLVIPSGVIVKGGYDSRTWQPSVSDQTIIFGLPGKTSMVLDNGSGIQDLILEQAGTAIRCAMGASSINRVVVLQSDQAVALSPFSYVRIANSDFINNATAIVADQTNKIFVYSSIFQTNTSLISSNVDSSSFIKNSLFFPNKDSIKNVQDQNNQVRADKPLPNAGWNFPDQDGGTKVNQSFGFDSAVDDVAKTIPGPTLESIDPINALFIYYQIDSGDTLRIVDRNDFSRVVMETPKMGGNFRGWIPVPASKKLALLLYTNGNQSLPLQIGVQATARITDSSYETQTANITQGIYGRSDDANFFYRPRTIDTTTTKLSEEQKNKIKAIEKPLILAGNDWLTGNDLNTSNDYTLTRSKGFISQILTNEGLEIASQNFEQRAKKASNEDRKLALISDYLHFETVFGLEEDCSLITTCPFEAEGLQKFRPWKQVSLQTTDPAIVENVGLLNRDGWNNGTNSDAHLKIDLSDVVKQGDIVWSEQIITPPTIPSHLLTFAHSTDANSGKNVVSISMNPDGNLQITSWDKFGIRTSMSTNGVSFGPGRKYQLILSFDGSKISLQRSDGIRLWQNDHFDWEGIRYIEAGKSPLPVIEQQVSQTLGNISVWVNSSSNRKISSSTGNNIVTTLTNEEHSLAGSVTFKVPSFCQASSLVFQNDSTILATISGTTQNNTCTLTLTSPLTTTAQTTVPLSVLNNQSLQFVWQTNSFSGLTTFNLISGTQEILSTLSMYGSKAIDRTVIIDRAQIRLASTSDSIDLQYSLLPQITLQNLTELVPVQRYELIYDTQENTVRNGQGTIVAITVDELKKTPTPEKIISGLADNTRYFFSARAILNDGGSSETGSIVDWQVHKDASMNTLQADTVNQSTLSSTLALANNLQYQTAYADQTIGASTSSSVTGDIIQNHLGDPVQLHGPNGTQAWSLGIDINSSTQEKAKHIYTIPGEYIVSSIRTLVDDTIIKQIGFVSVAGQTHDYPRIVAETWITKNNAPNWNNKSQAQKIPAVIGVNEPIYLLGQAVDVSGRSDDAYTWTYQIDWGDGTITNNNEAKIAFNKTHRVNGSAEEMPVQHVYRHPGIYTIVSQVKDETNHTGLFENTVLVTLPEVYPSQIRGISGSSTLVTISGGVAPYTVTLPDNSNVTLSKPGLLPVSIVDNSILLITDLVGNTTSIAIHASETPDSDVYLPKDRSLLLEPNAAKARDVIKITTQGEDHLMRSTKSHVYYFGDTLPSYLGQSLPQLNNAVTYTNEPSIGSEPFLTMGNFGAVLSVLDGNGDEQKKYFSLQITEARFVGQSQSGVVTGTIAPSLRTIPSSIEIWKRGSEDIKLASVTPNHAGRFIYFLPTSAGKNGFISFRMKDASGQYTQLSPPQGYDLEKRSEVLYGLLEAGNDNVLFDEHTTLATNTEKPTFFGKAEKSGKKYTVSVASDDPTDYQIVADQNGGWIVESEKALAEGKHHFSVQNDQGHKEAQYDFIVDRTIPGPPTITNASWTHIQGETEPYGYIGIKSIGKKTDEYFIQADSTGKFSLNPQNWSTQYLIAVADQAGNVSKLSTIVESEWLNASELSLWQKLKPYILWSVLIALAATSITYVRKVKV